MQDSKNLKSISSAIELNFLRKEIAHLIEVKIQ